MDDNTNNDRGRKIEAIKSSVNFLYVLLPLLYLIGVFMRHIGYPIPLAPITVIVVVYLAVILTHHLLSLKGLLIDFMYHVTPTFTSVIFITAASHYTGGVLSAVNLLYLVAIVANSVLYSFRSALFTAAWSSVFFTGLVLLEYNGVLPSFEFYGFDPYVYQSFVYGYIGNFVVLFFGLAVISGVLGERLRQESSRAEKHLEARTEFVDMLSHELRSPLNSISGFISLILGGKAGQISDEQKRFLEIAKEQSSRMTKIINDLLDISRIESRKIEIKKHPVLIEEVVQDVAEEMKPQLELKNIKLDVQIEKELPKALADSELVRQVLSNLMSNAVKFTGERGEINIAARKKKGKIEISVSDTGMGIRGEDLPKIFGKFYRAAGVSPKEKGTGLGLALCKETVEAMGGRISVESGGQGKGSKFTFVLQSGS